MDTYTCHSRWCPTYLPSFMDRITGLPATALCKNISWPLQNLFDSSEDQVLIRYNEWLLPACKLWCGVPGYQLLQLQSAGLSLTMAILIWFMVILMMVCVGAQLVSVCVERGARKVAMVGEPLFLAFMALIVYFCASDYVDTEFYPIVGAMNVAAFSYYFSSFQYSIGVTYELASATALVFTMLPVWSLLTTDRINFLGEDSEGYSVRNRASVEEMIWLVLTMLILSLFWIIHSSIYRTVVYRATWIAAFNNQRREGRTRGKDVMSWLWILSGAQGHPTWRTPTGQSFGLYLTVFSWVVAVRIHLLGRYCKEDLILFHILLWAPPVFLTLAVLATQVCMCTKASCDIQDHIRSSLWEWFMGDFESLSQSKPHMEEALISFRLGRDSLEVENSDKVRKYKIAWCCGKVEKKLGGILWGIEALLMAIAYPGILVCKISQWLGVSILRYTTSCFTWLNWSQSSSSFKLSEKIKAYQIVRERCFEDTVNLSGEMSDIYERSRMEHHGLQDTEIDEDLCNMLRNHRKDIKLPLVLDNIGPSCFSYVLERLVEVLKENLAEVANSTRESESLIDEEIANDTEEPEVFEEQETNGIGEVLERHEDQEATNGTDQQERQANQETNGTNRQEWTISVASGEIELQDQNQ